MSTQVGCLVLRQNVFLKFSCYPNLLFRMLLVSLNPGWTKEKQNKEIFSLENKTNSKKARDQFLQIIIWHLSRSQFHWLIKIFYSKHIANYCIADYCNNGIQKLSYLFIHFCAICAIYNTYLLSLTLMINTMIRNIMRGGCVLSILPQLSKKC